MPIQTLGVTLGVPVSSNICHSDVFDKPMAKLRSSVQFWLTVPLSKQEAVVV